MNPTRMAEKPMFPTHRSNPSDGEPDAVKVARPVRRGGWRKPAGAVRPSAAPSLPNAPPPTGSETAICGDQKPGLALEPEPSTSPGGSNPSPAQRVRLVNGIVNALCSTGRYWLVR